MKKQHLMWVFAAAAAIGLTGCHTCLPPEKSLECYPICKKLKAENEKNTKQDWENFKKTPHYPFTPTRRYAKIDELGKILSDLSFQVKNEIVIPYIELDKEGLISGFYEFEANVNATMKTRKCGLQEAVSLVLADWQRLPNGQEKCRKLVQALPVLQRLRASNQIRTAILRLSPQILRLVKLFRQDPTFSKEFNQLKADFRKAMRGKSRETTYLLRTLSAALSSLSNLISLNKSVNYLKIYLEDLSSQREALEKFIQDFDKNSRKSDQHNL